MKIAFVVLMIHFAVITSLIQMHAPNAKKIPSKQVVVKTYIQNPNPQKPIFLTSAPAIIQTQQKPDPIINAKKSEEVSMQSSSILQQSVSAELKNPVKETSTPTKKVNAKLKIKKNEPIKKAEAKSVNTSGATTKHSRPTSSTKTAQSTITTPQQEKLIAMMQQSLKTLSGTEKIQLSRDENTQNTMLGKLASEALSFTTSYEMELVSYLESLLTLPEKGKIKLKLTVNREGLVQELTFINHPNEKNRYYVESILSNLQLPPFGNQFKGKSSYTFTITLVGENSH